MKQYHTEIIIEASAETVWQVLTDVAAYPDWNPLVGKFDGMLTEGAVIATYIIPLHKTYFPKLLSVKENRELVWKGTQVAVFLLAGKHYYKLEPAGQNETRLLHGE